MNPAGQPLGRRRWILGTLDLVGDVGPFCSDTILSMGLFTNRASCFMQRLSPFNLSGA
jgi:hypothetical protein